MLTKDALEKLLLHLDKDRERAGEKYETLRLGLVRFFQWRGCAFPEDHADEAMDRVACKIVEGEEIRNIQGYITAAWTVPIHGDYQATAEVTGCFEPVAL